MNSGRTYEYATRGCSEEYADTQNQISYAWINGDKRNLRQTPGTNVSLETTYCNTGIVFELPIGQFNI